jgi:pyruvate/2-oxoglutarate/acetoin dehydrogenase E1 component
VGSHGLHGRRGRAAARGGRHRRRDPRPPNARALEKTSKALVLHEDTHTGGFGAEIAATITEEGFENLDAPVRRIAAPDTPVPFAPVLEKAFIPQVDDVVAGIKELAEY